MFERWQVRGKPFLWKLNVLINKWVEHSFIGQWQAAQVSSPLRHPAFKSLTHEGTPESLCLWCFDFSSAFLCILPKQISAAGRRSTHNIPRVAFYAAPGLFTWERSQHPIADGIIYLMFFFPLRRKCPKLCTLSSLNECSSHCVGHRLIKFAVWFSLCVEPKSCPPGKVPLLKALLGLVCWSGAVVSRSLPFWWKQSDFKLCFNGDDILSSALVMVLGLFLKIKSEGTELYNGDEGKMEYDYAISLFFLSVGRNTKRERYRKNTVTIQNKISSTSISSMTTTYTMTGNPRFWNAHNSCCLRHKISRVPVEKEIKKSHPSTWPQTWCLIPSIFCNLFLLHAGLCWIEQCNNNNKVLPLLLLIIIKK